MKEHDYRKSRWGHSLITCENISIEDTSVPKDTYSFMGFGQNVRVGDSLIVDLKRRDNGVVDVFKLTITECEYKRDPKDMFDIIATAVESLENNEWEVIEWA